jgi:hypothetical protein
MLQQVALPTDRARSALLLARTELDDEIRTYPSPVSGCDAQYNFLLAERRRVHAALEALDAEVHIPTPRAP